MSDETINEYLAGDDWRVKENANSGGITISGLKAHVVGDTFAKHALSVLPDYAKDAHESGRIHIHDLRGGIHSAYCCGHDLRMLLMEGLGTPGGIESHPAKHLDVAVDHIGQYIQILSNEWEGAQAFSSVDTLLAPFIFNDGLTQKEVNQCMQRLVYGLNFESRQAFQTPFSNLSFDWVVPDDLKDVNCIIGGQLQPYTYAEMQKYMDMINIGFLTAMIEGDAKGHPFTFPVPTYAVRDESMFEGYDDKTNLLWELTAKFGSPYFSNYLGSGIDPYTIRSMCCRLSLDLAEVADATSGIWDYGAKTGSLSVVTINANRAALESGCSRIAYLASINDAINTAKDVLLMRKNYILDAFEGGLMPYSKEYIGRLDSFFLTIGIIGVYDAWVNLDDGSAYDEFVEDTLTEAKNQVREFSTTTDWKLWNFEQTPMESGAYRLAKLDKEMHPDCKVGGDTTTGGIYLTNSTHLPVDNEYTAYHELEFRGWSDRMYSGGTLYNHLTNEHSSPESIRRLIRRICVNTKIPYVAYTPTFGICSKHGLKYKAAWCDECNEELTIYTRIVGYFRSVRKFNDGQFEQFVRRAYKT